MDVQMRNLATAVVATLAMGYAAQSPAQVTGSSTYVSNSGAVVHCVSTESGRTFCGRPHQRYVIRGTAPTECVEGTTWGIDDDHGVWVTGGCKADFVLAERSMPSRTSTTTTTTVTNNSVVHCISTASGRTFCGRPHMHYVIRGTAPTECVEGTTWGVDDDHGVWVTGGCKADFTIQDN